MSMNPENDGSKYYEIYEYCKARWESEFHVFASYGRGFIIFYADEARTETIVQVNIAAIINDETCWHNIMEASEYEFCLSDIMEASFPLKPQLMNLFYSYISNILYLMKKQFVFKEL